MPKDSLARMRLAERELDKGTGACTLRNPVAASMVFESVRKFDGERYSLWACCVMPNHVHAILSPEEDYRLEQILHSWKSYTAKKINLALGLRGRLWEPEYFDHLVRSGGSLEKFVHYIQQNPVEAGLRDWPWVYVCGPELDS
jgi:REP element-mobilizing transposase RayT